MKKILLFLLALAPLHAADAPADPWTTLDRHATEMAAAVRARDTHPLHQIDQAVGTETAALRAANPAPAATREKLDALLADLAAQAHAAHVDGHHAQWDEAAAAQTKFAADVKAARALAAP